LFHFKGGKQKTKKEVNYNGTDYRDVEIQKGIDGKYINDCIFFHLFKFSWSGDCIVKNGTLKLAQIRKHNTILITQKDLLFCNSSKEQQCRDITLTSFEQ